MSSLIKLTEEAKEDIRQAAEWYNEQKNGLGDLFLHQLNESLISIQRNPGSFKKIYRQLRQTAIKKFPYVVLDKTDNNAILIYCVFYTSRDPKKKLKRFKL